MYINLVYTMHLHTISKANLSEKIKYAVRVGPPLDTQTPVRDTNTYASVCSLNNN